MELEHKHNDAIRDEIGERLKVMLAREPPNLPPSLTRLLRRFEDLDHEASPSIVPEVYPEAERPEPSSTSAWLQRLRDLTRRS